MMQLRTTILKFTNLFLTLGLTLFITQQTNAQKVKIDGVAVVIGKNIVLDSDIEKFKKDLEDKSEGKLTISKCEMLEELMMQKLLSHHAVVDSVQVSDAEVSEKVQATLRFLESEFGSEEKMVAAYGFNNKEDLRQEIYEVQKENILVQKEQAKITDKIDVTPEEVRLYYNGLKNKGELPEISAEVELAQIVIKIKPTDDEIESVRNKLLEIKKELEDGASFRMKAIINSDDPAVVNNSGEYEITKDSPFIKEFKEMAFSLDIGQISEPFESDFGFHLMQLNAVRGEARVASHILIRPKISEDQINNTKNKANKIVEDIRKGKITFEEAVKKYSDDENTKNSGGLIMNPYTGEHFFDLTRMDPDLYTRVVDLNQGELTDAYYDIGQTGEKSFRFILMKTKSKNHIADLVEDYVKIQELALQKKQEETINKWAKDKIKDTYIKISTTHNNCDFKKNWKKETNK